MKIAISKGIGSAKYIRYAEWVKNLDPSLECVELSMFSRDEALRELDSCGGLILCGGPDVDPNLYNCGARIGECHTDAERDERERLYIDNAMKQNMSILGVCRGMQLLNVYFGGSLIVDIPTDIPKAVIHSDKDPNIDAWHEVLLEKSFGPVFSSRNGLANSAHHQSVDRMADMFRPAARTADGVIEAMVPVDFSLPVFGVQWHPERMSLDNPLSHAVGMYFISKCTH